MRDWHSPPPRAGKLRSETSQELEALSTPDSIPYPRANFPLGNCFLWMLNEALVIWKGKIETFWCNKILFQNNVINPHIITFMVFEKNTAELNEEIKYIHLFFWLEENIKYIFLQHYLLCTNSSGYNHCNSETSFWLLRIFLLSVTFLFRHYTRCLETSDTSEQLINRHHIWNLFYITISCLFYFK